jgi:hypothetical protein
MLAPLSEELFKDMDGIEMINTEDGNFKEPDLLPVTFPSLFANATSGIAVGLSANIFPYPTDDICDAVIELIETGDITKILVPDFETGGYIVNNEKEYLRVSPDRTFWLPDMPKNDRNKGILECKTTQATIEQDNIPMHWYCQLQYQLGVAELEHGALAWLTAGRNFDYRDYVFEKDFFDYMIGEVDRFWVDNILGKKEPLLYNVDDVLLRNPRHVLGKFVEADEQLLASCAELKEIKEELSALDNRKKEIEERIKMAIGDAEALVVPGSNKAKPEVLASWKTAKDSTKFNEKQFAMDNPELHAQYTIQVPGSRRFLI